MSAIDHLYTPEVLQTALRLRYEGMAWEAIAKQLAVPYDGLRRRLEPGYATKRNQKIAEARSRLVLAGGVYSERLGPDEAAKAIAAVPIDSRRLTARVCGDPLPGRSALDRLRDPKPSKVSAVYSPVRAEKTYYPRGFLWPMSRA